MTTSRQLSQRMCRDREHQSQQNEKELRQHACRFDEQQLSMLDEPLLPQQNRSQWSQQARRDREGMLRQRELPIACRAQFQQSSNVVSFRHQRGRCNIACNFCGAEHWIEERVQGSAKAAPQFSTCCEGGAIAMDKFEDPPQPLYSLLMNSAPCIFLFDILC